MDDWRTGVGPVPGKGLAVMAGSWWRVEDWADLLLVEQLLADELAAVGAGPPLLLAELAAGLVAVARDRGAAPATLQLWIADEPKPNGWSVAGYRVWLDRVRARRAGGAV